MKLNDRIRELRTKGDLTLKDLAQRSGLSVSYLSDLERGRTIPSISTLEALARSFDISVLDLLAGVDFAGEVSGSSLPPGLKELLDDPDYSDEIKDDWVNLLCKIELRGTRPSSKREWLELYLALKRILD